MGWNICGVVINSLPDIKEVESLDKKKLKTKHKKTKLSGLSPKDLSIGFKENNTLIFLDMLFLKNISEEKELTGLETDLCTIFPGSRILIFVVNDSADFTGYSLIENGIKIRTKAVVGGEIFLDYGDIHSKELEVHNEYYITISKNPNNVRFMEEKFASFDESQKKKMLLKARDRTYSISKVENDFNYSNGSLDQFIIESELKNIVNVDYVDLENLDYIEFERRKLNFKKDSLKEYLYVAVNKLS